MQELIEADSLAFRVEDWVIKTPEEIIQDISDILAWADGEFIEEIANRVLTRKVKYEGDSMFTQEDPK